MAGYIEVRGVRIGEGVPKICVPVIGQTRTEILANAAALEDEVFDIVEWRADWFDGISDFAQTADILKNLRQLLGNKPVLFTFRTKKEGGEKAIEEGNYVKLNKKAVTTGCVDLVDVEAFTGDNSVKEIIAEAHANGVKVIVSNHDFDKTPSKEELVTRLCRMQQLGADILKIAVMPQKKKDVLTLLTATEEMVSEHADCPIITMSMARTGMISRLCGEVFGSAVTFGSAGRASAPGQISVHDLHDVLNVIHKNLKTEEEEMKTNGDTDNIFLIGFMGTGKSTIANELKNQMNRELIDIDQMIVEENGMPISQIFADYGEDHFRDLESNALIRLQSREKLIVSCGGGVVVRAENAGHMKKSGYVVLLTAKPETIYERVKDSQTRPILNGHMNVEFIHNLMEQRREKYEAAADFTVATDGKTVKQICGEIVSGLSELERMQ